MTELKQRLQNNFCRHEALVIWLISISVFMLGIWQQPFINFETRFAVFAQEMLRNGLTLFPTTYGQPYPDYPVTSTALIWLFSLPFGQVTKFSAVLPTALASATIIALSYKLFAQYSKRWGLLAVGFEFLTFTFVAESRSISVDQMLSAITIAAFYLTHKAYLEKSALPTKWLTRLLIVGFLVRGPIGVVIPAGVVFSHLLLTSCRREIIFFAASSAGMLLACSAALLGLAMLIYGHGFVSDIIKMQAVSRFAEAEPSPKYYYFISSLGNYALSYPIALIVALGVLLAKLRNKSPIFYKEHARIGILLLAWIGVVLVGLSIPETKKVRYILPIVPALAGLASYVFINNEHLLLKWLRRAVELILLLLPLLATALIYTKKTKFADYGINSMFCMAVLLAIFIANIVLLILSKEARTNKSLFLCFAAVLTACFFQIMVVEPVDLHLHDTGEFVRHIESLRQKTPGSLAFYGENPDGLPIKYLVNARMDFSPQFIKDPKELENNSSPIWLLTKEKNREELRRAGIDTEALSYSENFETIPFLAIYIPACSVTPLSQQNILP